MENLGGASSPALDQAGDGGWLRGRPWIPIILFPTIWPLLESRRKEGAARVQRRRAISVRPGAPEPEASPLDVSTRRAAAPSSPESALQNSGAGSSPHQNGSRETPPPPPARPDTPQWRRVDRAGPESGRAADDGGIPWWRPRGPFGQGVPPARPPSGPSGQGIAGAESTIASGEKMPAGARGCNDPRPARTRPAMGMTGAGIGSSDRQGRGLRERGATA